MCVVLGFDVWTMLKRVGMLPTSLAVMQTLSALINRSGACTARHTCTLVLYHTPINRNSRQSGRPPSDLSISFAFALF